MTGTGPNGKANGPRERTERTQVEATMACPNQLPHNGYFDLQEIQDAMQAAVREAVLEHARVGRPVCEVRNNQIVWLTPEQVFAEYGLDENGKPPKT